MPIKSFELVSVEAKRFSKLGEKFQQLRVDQNTTVTSVTAVSERDAQFEFRFTVNYSGVGLIKLEGRLVWDGDAKTLASQWGQTSKLPNEVNGPILTAIYANCMPAAIISARDIALPPPIPLPQFQGQPQQKPGGKDKGRSMEVA